MKFVAQTDNK